MIAEAEEFVRLRTSEKPDNYQRASNEPASIETWLGVIERFPEMRFWVAQNKTVPIAILERLATDQDLSVREMVARKRSLPAAIFEQLAGDPEEGVRAALARNAKAPVAVLDLLLGDKSDLVRQAVAERSDP